MLTFCFYTYLVTDQLTVSGQAVVRGLLLDSTDPGCREVDSGFAGDVPEGTRLLLPPSPKLVFLDIRPVNSIHTDL